MPEPAPAPDPHSGEPRPPRAPVWSETKNPKRRDARLAKYPPAPEGTGPVLEWDQAPMSTAFKSGIFMAALVMVFLCLKDWGVSWMGTWWLWLFVVWPIPLFWILGRSKGISAGARWFASGSSYVNTYELKKVTVENSGGGLSKSLFLTDSEGHEVGVSMYQVQRNRALWDLVYNGIVYSLRHNRAVPNKKSVDELCLY